MNAERTTAIIASNPHCRLGENPVWHPLEKKLYWCDITYGRLYRFAPETQETELVYDGSMDRTQIGGFTIEEDGALLLFMGNGRIDRWRQGKNTTVLAASHVHRGMRFNDVIADPAGRVFCGTVDNTGSRPGSLYRLDLDGTLTSIVDDVLCSNGLAFSTDHNQLYHTDSRRHIIYRFDYSVIDGSLSNRVAWIKVNDKDGLPDGLTIDSDGYLWSANWGAGCVIRYTPEGTENLRVRFPTPKVSSVAFGGNDLTTLFVTSAGGGSPPVQDSVAGALFMIRNAATGLAEFSSRICCLRRN